MSIVAFPPKPHEGEEVGISVGDTLCPYSPPGSGTALFQKWSSTVVATCMRYCGTYRNSCPLTRHPTHMTSHASLAASRTCWLKPKQKCSY